jgi:hypothetical protein
MPDFNEVKEFVEHAEAIAWDTCHKIYVLMDNEQVDKMREYGYADEPDAMFTKADKSADEMLEIVKDWYEKSCFLRFVEAVQTTPAHIDPNEGFMTLIPQGADDE